MVILLIMALCNVHGNFFYFTFYKGDIGWVVDALTHACVGYLLFTVYYNVFPLTYMFLYYCTPAPAFLFIEEAMAAAAVHNNNELFTLVVASLFDECVDDRLLVGC
jgi:hypothetical protein